MGGVWRIADEEIINKKAQDEKRIRKMHKKRGKHAFKPLFLGYKLEEKNLTLEGGGGWGCNALKAQYIPLWSHRKSVFFCSCLMCVTKLFELSGLFGRLYMY